MDPNDSPKSAEKQPPADTFTILYIEDDEANRQLVKFIMARRSDLNLIDAEDGKTGLDKAFQHRPSLILLDLSLPDIDGFAVLKELLADKKTQEIPIIAISGNNTPSDIDAGFKAGFKGYLSKPVNIEKLYNTIDTNLGIGQ